MSAEFGADNFGEIEHSVSMRKRLGELASRRVVRRVAMGSSVIIIAGVVGFFGGKEIAESNLNAGPERVSAAIEDLFGNESEAVGTISSEDLIVDVEPEFVPKLPSDERVPVNVNELSDSGLPVSVGQLVASETKISGENDYVQQLGEWLVERGQAEKRYTDESGRILAGDNFATVAENNPGAKIQIIYVIKAPSRENELITIPISFEDKVGD